MEEHISVCDVSIAGGDIDVECGVEIPSVQHVEGNTSMGTYLHASFLVFPLNSV
jgi:hypothetical protein